MNDQISLFFALDGQTHEITIKLKVAADRNLQSIFDVTTKQARMFCMGNRISGTQQVKYVGNTFVFCFGFIL